MSSLVMVGLEAVFMSCFVTEDIEAVFMSCFVTEDIDAVFMSCFVTMMDFLIIYLSRHWKYIIHTIK
jgi:hypothetical protein